MRFLIIFKYKECGNIRNYKNYNFYRYYLILNYKKTIDIYENDIKQVIWYIVYFYSKSFVLTNGLLYMTDNYDLYLANQLIWNFKG